MRDQVDNISSGIGPVCLYIGPKGRRCTRRATEDGFCEGHGPNAAGRGRPVAPRRMVAVILGLAVLGPILLELWREVSQFTK